MLFLSIVLRLVTLIGAVSASCECGYTALVGNDTISYLFTDLIETDFLHEHNVTLDTDWRRQNFTVSAAAARGPLGMNFTLAEVNTNPISNASIFTGPGIYGGDPGLTLSVSGGIPPDGFVPGAEIDSARTDLLYGSYRASMKLTSTPGTCSAFFWYYDDSQEIDMEFLSSQFDFENQTFPVNLVLQSQDSVRAGYDAAKTGNYIVANLPFNPTTDYHEYRIDFTATHVIFYGDGQQLGHMGGSAVPTSPGHMILTQWSNGNPLWSSGPPAQQANVSISYVKAYFNSSDPKRQKDWAVRCHDPAAEGATCAIPDLVANTATAGGNMDVSAFFFSHQQNQTVNQTVFHENAAAGLGGISGMAVSGLLTLILVLAGALTVL